MCVSGYLDCQLSQTNWSISVMWLRCWFLSTDVNGPNSAALVRCVIEQVT